MVQEVSDDRIALPRKVVEKGGLRGSSAREGGLGGVGRRGYVRQTLFR